MWPPRSRLGSRLDTIEAMNRACDRNEANAYLDAGVISFVAENGAEGEIEAAVNAHTRGRRYQRNEHVDGSVVYVDREAERAAIDAAEPRVIVIR